MTDLIITAVISGISDFIFTVESRKLMPETVYQKFQTVFPLNERQLPCFFRLFNCVRQARDLRGTQ